ncbi:ribonuclease D [Reyranella sp.]|jgi:ribonuclease D|uniref:ribonuclease D n=1 Tax=Reyranella sp. TaxID=1929291 RepID=UPI000BC8FCF7|nr:ribonuclease D [Reyranella sp.]OYY46130.1 MAG: ribonuclease D [Rhodospirillales bacterium 35-66-84]OYZ96510.1 MAG: ribonuclease D [Rhodospirillales bacterium 24-66-33]OZB28326.1 MAG: ribonuclease D [Rhodospirillales bacterium 39-66-50]HQS14470.1 ribonuclease D [Reyranella sp.]HQT11467.1 ribonuclease D [Reyranella sp.]
MKLITTTDELAAFCKPLADTEFVAVDTEFMRERTYWPKLCLAQVAGPEDAAAIDTLAEGIDLAPLDELMLNPKVLKVFHAARQDLEIFYLRLQKVPGPLFDTQVAAMVCGHGEAASYESLATRLAKAKIDKSSRFTDWSRRPLSERQITYALSDVTHLRVVYEKLKKQLDKTGRFSWIAEEMAVLNDPAIYRADPEQAWRRLKPRGASPRMMAVLKEIAAWRERTAQRIDIPRQRLVRDEQLLEIASHAPKTIEELAATRGLGRGFAEGWQGRELMEAIERARALPESELPVRDKAPEQLRAPGAIVDLLRTLLRLKAEHAGVAGRLVASADELDRLAAGKRDIAALKGWRNEVFGSDAVDLIEGRLALALNGDQPKLIQLPPDK